MYLITLLILLIFYISVIFIMKYMKNSKVWNIVFAITIFALYISHILIIYNSVGAKDWNFLNTMPVANVSPFMFALSPLILILPNKIRKYFYILISLLFVGMLLSAVFNCIYNTVISYKFHIHFVLDYLSHILISLWGIYLIRSNQVQLTKKDSLVSTAIIISIATIMLILNVIFDTAFFGLSLNGKHNIYNVVLVNNSYLSAVIYYLGIILVTTIGYIFQKLLNRNITNK